jgi:ubiquinone/menaquinone biosynthesis C-methylase UbiE
VSSRPPLHPQIVGRLAARLGIHAPLPRALDIGCGVGLSTAPLAALARRVVGLDPALAMLGAGRRIAPDAGFTAGRAEAMPFKAGSFDLVTAAGAVNYADLDRFFPEVTRVLAQNGRLAIYDFGSGRRFQEGPDLDSWFASFEGRYPFPPGYALDVKTLPYSRFGLTLHSFDEFELVVPMALASYFAYAMTETNVEQAISEGSAESEIRAWCLETLAPLFGAESRPVVFPAYIACLARSA